MLSLRDVTYLSLSGIPPALPPLARPHRNDRCEEQISYSAIPPVYRSDLTVMALYVKNTSVEYLQPLPVSL